MTLPTKYIKMVTQTVKMMVTDSKEDSLQTLHYKPLMETYIGPNGERRRRVKDRRVYYYV